MLFVQPHRLTDPSGRRVGVGQVVAEFPGVGMVRARLPLAVGEVLFPPRDRLAQLSAPPVGMGQFASAAPSGIVIWAVPPLGGLKGPLVQRDGFFGPAYQPERE